MKRALRSVVYPMLLSGLCACGGGDDGVSGTGKVRVLLVTEDTVTEGLGLGDGPENTRDYAVTFTKYLVTVGQVKLGKELGGSDAQLPDVYVADMLRVGEAGVELGVLDDLDAGQWSEFGFATPRASAGAKALGGVSAGDLATMIDGGFTYWIEGVVQRAEAEGGPVTFSLQMAVPTVFSGCEKDGEPGVAVVADMTGSATITLHGDHIFFDRFLTGAEGTAERLAGWVVAADVDGDGKVSTADLADLDPTTVLADYELGGARDPVESVLDFVRQQLATQGHYAGEGECSWQLSGV